MAVASIYFTDHLFAKCLTTPKQQLCIIGGGNLGLS